MCVDFIQIVADCYSMCRIIEGQGFPSLSVA